jgi:hypothetical protein
VGNFSASDSNLVRYSGNNFLFKMVTGGIVAFAGSTDEIPEPGLLGFESGSNPVRIGFVFRFLCPFSSAVTD